jgi:hypothetical protein
MLLKKHKKVGLLEHKDMRYDIGITFLVALLVFFAGFRPAQAQTKRIEVNFSHRTLSAMIREAPLREVIAAIEKKGIWFKLWFKGKESVLNEKVSVRFKGLPLKEGLERILSTLNHCLVFDHNGVLSGVILLGKPERRTTRSTRRIRTPRRYNPRR